MTVRIPLIRDTYLTLISMYAPILTSEDDVKTSFYNLLDCTIQTVPAHNKLIVSSDFNGRVGCDHCHWNGILGHYGIGKCNANARLLLVLCAKHELVTTNSLFRLLPDKRRLGNTGISSTTF
ncbi:craniofacial development protein 2-like [Octopus sinensis]|uniref:Craniofacial development protein 2-like n=1 Tax=Octopus sinensis TaxID=2607531 RepID=A0A6P7TML1_9MOLL|nr:craniofacial development protein 2-like [Octopus sinensis]